MTISSWKIDIVDRFIRGIAYILLFLMLAFPMELPLLYVKAFLFAILVYFATLGIIIKGKIALHQNTLMLALFMISIGLFFSLKGCFADTPGALKQMQVYALWPLIYIVLIAESKDSTLLKGFQWTLIVVTIFISLYGISNTLSQLGIIPYHFTIDLFQNESNTAYGFYDGFIEILVPGLNTVPFLLPFCFAAIVCWLPDMGCNSIKRIILWIAFILIIALSIISGRKAIWVILALSPILTLLLLMFKCKEEKRRAKAMFVKSFFSLSFALVLIYILLNIIYEFNIINLSKYFISGFDFSDVELARREQFSALLKGWLDNFLLGSGLGASAEVYGSLRSSDMPWAYELYYLALLFQVGLIGFLIYSASIIWIYYMSLKIIRYDSIYGNVLLPFVAGMSGMLIAGATNPYFARFDGLWFLFLPIAVINRWTLFNRNAITTKI